MVTEHKEGWQRWIILFIAVILTPIIFPFTITCFHLGSHIISCHNFLLPQPPRRTKKLREIKFLQSFKAQFSFHAFTSSYQNKGSIVSDSQNNISAFPWRDDRCGVPATGILDLCCMTAVWFSLGTKTTLGSTIHHRLGENHYITYSMQLQLQMYLCYVT